MPPRIATAWLVVAMLALAPPTSAWAVCTLDPGDPFEPHASMPRGPFAGRCLDTSEERSIRILSPDQAAAYGLAPDRDRIFVIANLRHAGRYWVAEIDPQAVEEVILQVEHFPAIVPAAHTQLCFRFRPGQGPRLVPQIGPADPGLTRLTDLVYSVEAAYLVHGEPYDLVKGMQNHYATAYRFVSLESRYRQMVFHDHHRVEQIRLKLAPEERRRLLIRALRDSDTAQLGRMYHTLALNCTTELIRAIDRSVTYSAWQRLLAAVTFFLDRVPTECRGQLALRGLIPDRDEPPLPDLEKDRGLPFLAPAAAARP
jgi:hypothetical protein